MTYIPMLVLAVLGLILATYASGLRDQERAVEKKRLDEERAAEKDS